METNDLNYLLQSIYYKKDVICFDDIYFFYNDFLIKYANTKYINIIDKYLNNENDVIQESWLNIWLFLAENKYNVKTEKEFKDFLCRYVDDTILKLNNN